MKRITKSSGSGGRLRLGLLLATVAAFLLVPAASAFANAPAEIVFAGEGAGWVKGEAGAEGGVPHVECHWDGTKIDIGIPAAGECKTTAQNVGIGQGGILVFGEADAGSDLFGWEVDEKGGIVAPVSGCQSPVTAQSEGCAAVSFSSAVPIVIKATFVEEAKPEFKLNLSTSGTGSGSFKCDSGSGPGPCAEKYKEGKVVKVIPVANEGSEFVEWTGDCSGSGSCEVTMNAEHSVGAVFNTAKEAFSVTQEGEGTVQCEDNGGGLGACASTYLFGHTIKVVATPASEYVIGSLTGTGSAAGKCNKETGICEFVIKAASSVTAKFEPQGKKAQVTGNVFGEVPQTTSLKSACSSVDLGKFLPGVAASYSNTCALTVTSTGAATSLTASDESATHTGHLVQGSYFLLSALEANATDTEGLGGVGGPLAPLTSPVTLLTYATPVSADGVQVKFNQPIGLHDPLHTGVYAKTITLTLEQTTP